MPFATFRKNKEAVELNSKKTIQQIQQHLHQLNNKMVATLNMNLSNFEEISSYARNIKWEAIEGMASYIESFEENWQSNNPNNNEIYWANTAEEAEYFIEKILRKTKPEVALKIYGAELVELELSNILKKYKIQEIWANWEHELLAFLDEELHHPLFPLIHKNITEINESLEDIEQKLKSPLNFWLAEHKSKIIDLNPKKTVAFVHAHFLCPDLGAVVFSDNEGLYAQATQTANTVVVIAGIDRVVQSSNNINIMSGMINALSNGEYLAPALQYLMGSFREEQEVVVILLDNSRSELLKDIKWRNILYDLDGINWLNQCHDYPYLAPQNYHPFHFGPISALLSPLFYEEIDFKSSHTFWADIQDGFLPHPLSLDFKKLLLYLRKDLYDNNEEKTESIHAYWKAHEATLKDTLGIKKWKLRRKIQQIIGEERALPPLAKKTFMQGWREQIQLANSGK